MTSKDDAKKIKQQIEELLNMNRTSKGGADYTHVSMGGITFPGKFNFVDSKQRKILAKLVSKAFEKGVYFSIAEKIKEYAPIMIDIDIRMPKDSSDDTQSVNEQSADAHLYDNDLIFKIIGIYRDCINKFLKTKDVDMECFVFEKDKTGEKNGELADGIHIIFPNIVANTKLRHIIFKNVYDICMEQELFSHFSNNSSVLDDKIVSTNPWLMYGCAKPNGEPYILTHVYDNDNEDIDITKYEDKYELTRLLSLRESKWAEENATKLKVDNKEIDSLYNDIRKNNTKVIDSESEIIDIPPEDKLEMIEKAMKMTEMLLPKRADNYHEWLRVGWALHNTHTSLIDTWVQFSRQSKKYAEGECQKLWSNMKDDGYTLRSLMLWAKEDSPEEYKKFIKEDFENYLKKNSVSNTFMIAKAYILSILTSLCVQILKIIFGIIMLIIVGTNVSMVEHLLH